MFELWQMLFCIIPVAIVSSAIFIYADIIDGTSSKGLTTELQTTTATRYVVMQCRLFRIWLHCSELDRSLSNNLCTVRGTVCCASWRITTVTHSKEVPAKIFIWFWMKLEQMSGMHKKKVFYLPRCLICFLCYRNKDFFSVFLSLLILSFNTGVAASTIL